MDQQFLANLLAVGALTSLRADDSVTRQGVMNHQVASHLMDLSFIRDSVEFSIPEAYAVEGLKYSSTTQQGLASNLAATVPPSYTFAQLKPA
jgi:hypothetical protein